MENNFIWDESQRNKADEIARAVGERVRYEGPRLTIRLGKNFWKTDQHGTAETLRMIFPELVSPRIGVVIPQHPDNFVDETVGAIEWNLKYDINVELVTLSGALVNQIATAVADGEIPSQAVFVLVYEADNETFKRYGINEAGFLCNLGDGEWPFGWFELSNIKEKNNV